MRKKEETKKDSKVKVNVVDKKEKKQKEFPEKFPFWARLKIGKNRTTLVIDEEEVVNKKTKIKEPGFVHREATSTEKAEFEKIDPNPDKDKEEPMFLKRPRKHPKRLFNTHNKELDMPEHLKDRYSKNNKK